MKRLSILSGSSKYGRQDHDRRRHDAFADRWFYCALATHIRERIAHFHTVSSAAFPIMGRLSFVLRATFLNAGL